MESRGRAVLHDNSTTDEATAHKMVYPCILCNFVLKIVVLDYT
jgi:hypothetical protein